MELSTIGRIIGIIVVACTLVIMAVNGLTMMLSPTLWFKLPDGLAGRRRGSVMARNSVGIRIMGFAILSVLGTIVWAFLTTPSQGQVATEPLSSKVYGWVVYWIVTLGVAAYGFAALIAPLWWFRTYFVSRKPEMREVESHMKAWIRISGCTCIVVALYLAWRWFRG